MRFKRQKQPGVAELRKVGMRELSGEHRPRDGVSGFSRTAQSMAETQQKESRVWALC